MSATRSEWYRALYEQFEHAVLKTVRDGAKGDKDLPKEVERALEQFGVAVRSLPEHIRPEVWQLVCQAWDATLTHAKRRNPCPESQHQRPVNAP